MIFVDQVQALPPTKEIPVPDDATQVTLTVERSTSADPQKWPQGGVCWVLFIAPSGGEFNFFAQLSASGGVKQDAGQDTAQTYGSFGLPAGKSRRVRVQPIYFTDSPPFDLHYAIDFK